MKLLSFAAKIAAQKYNILKRYQFGCVARRTDGALVSSTNHHENHQQFSHHAEARILRKSDIGSILFIARVSKKDRKTWRTARPCARCRKLIEHHKIKEVYYTIGPNEYGCWKPGESTEVTRTIK